MVRLPFTKPMPVSVVSILEGSDYAMPKEESAWVHEHYDRASVILEYGSGASTIYAASEAGNTVFSVESDRAWADSMREHLEASGPAATVHMHHCDIGPTGEWGNPVNEDQWRQFHHYPLDVWDREDFQHPDVVLIDGRFRRGCLLAAMMRIERPTVVLFDDYVVRPYYKPLEEFVQPVETRGRMAKFELEPWALPPRALARVWDMFTMIG